MKTRPRMLGKLGFTLIELLLVLTIIGIISAIAIPSFLGSREYARQVGDARTHGQALRMALESTHAENGVYPAAGTFTWLPDGSAAPVFVPAVNFILPKNASKMKFILVINADKLTYTIEARTYDTKDKQLLKIDQNGSNI